MITIRRFRIYRPNAPEGHLASGAANAPDEVQLEGCLFSDGTVSVRWMTQFRSFSNWDSWAAFDAVHGHPEYGTVVEWLDGDVDTLGPPPGREQINLLARRIDRNASRIREAFRGGWKADLVIVDEPSHQAEISGDCPDCGLPWVDHLWAAETLNQPVLADLIRKTASEPPPPGMAWSLAYEKLTGRRHPEQDELVPKAGMPEYDSQGLATFLADRYAQTLGHRRRWPAPVTKDWTTGRDLYTLQDGRLIKPDTTKGGESP